MKKGICCFYDEITGKPKFQIDEDLIFEELTELVEVLEEEIYGATFRDLENHVLDLEVSLERAEEELREIKDSENNPTYSDREFL